MTTPAAPSLPSPPPAAPAPARRLPDEAFGSGLPYHRLVFARRRTGWWTPLVVGLLGVALYLAMTGVAAVAVIVATLSDPDGGSGILSLTEDVVFDLTDPLVIAVLLGSIALMLPAYVLASLIVNGRRVGLVSSAAGRLRWGWMLGCAAAAVVVAVALTAVSMLLPAEAVDASGSVVAPEDNPQLWLTFLVLLLIVPLQAAAEEYVFRGYLMQSIGRWLRHPAFAILLPVPLFVAGHLYDPLGQASVAVFAIAAGWLTWRTGGLEAAIALHVVNNLMAFLMGLAGLADVNATSPGVASFVWSALVIVAYVGVVEWLFRRTRLRRTLRLTRPQAASESASRIVYA
ncbi:CPBP family intramembrane glutamic endopeptidase [Microbacterium sp. RU33B]|uniref:CPBP family intramembrane glutamic endopeptidase n=1 Tax=Microbacterium sp. RU33B TaxID=1907390 RepID=UPI000961B1DC|nr:CPBP family intramembrane glutamic endopeptidase [Microbacterium sp. RU33B]SIT70084.1 Membrane protease YdiL, CAAX protease family [Microbacterium sp. RU33B]